MTAIVKPRDSRSERARGYLYSRMRRTSAARMDDGRNECLPLAICEVILHGIVDVDFLGTPFPIFYVRSPITILAIFHFRSWPYRILARCSDVEWSDFDSGLRGRRVQLLQQSPNLRRPRATIICHDPRYSCSKLPSYAGVLMRVHQVVNPKRLNDVRC
ncbi:hypothetical protein MPTK2_4g22410 [Marchantia polymorpha subsp. ruderalis]